MRIKSLFTLLFTLLIVALNAQDKVQVKGKVQAGASAPVEFATVSLESTEDGLVAETVTDAKGEFKLEAVIGKYVLVIEPLGYETSEKNIDLQANLDLGIIRLQAEETIDLATAVITIDKPIYKVELDKKVYDMANDPMSQGSSLSDALQNVPSVQVDAEGNVSLRGNDNVKFLIDGKPSGMLGISDPAEALKNIPAEMVERIEVVTNPSSRYEASGSAGIINIVLKKGKNNGLNGSVTLNGGIPDMLGVNASINYRVNKFNLFTSIGSRYSDREGEGQNRTTYLDQAGLQERRTNTDRTNNRIRRNYDFRLGGDYYLDEKNTFSLSGGIRHNNGDNQSNVLYRYFDAVNTLVGTEERVQNEKDLRDGYDFDFGFKHEFDKKGHELSVNGRFSASKEKEDALINQFQQAIITSNEGTDSQEKQNSLVVSADYVRPIGEKGKFEVGFRGDFDNTKTKFSAFEVLANGSINQIGDFTADIDNQQNVYAAYAQYGNAIGQLQYFAGLRLESSDMKIDDLKNNSSIKKTYTDLFPSATLNYTFNPKNELQASYSRRVRRPMGFQLIPFFTYSDNKNTMIGNPDLNPSYTNSFEVSYITTIGKLMVTPSVFYQKTTDMVQMFQRRDFNNQGEDIFITQPINEGDEQRYGLDLTVTYRPFRWWNLMANVNLFGYDRTGSYEYDNKYKDPITNQIMSEKKIADFSGDGFSSRGRVSSNFRLPNDFNIQLASNFMGSIKTAEQKIASNVSMDLSLSKDFFKKSMTVSFNVRDVFDSRKREITNYREDYTSQNTMRWMVRSFNLSIAYRFKQQKKQEQRPQMDDMEGGDMMM